MLFTKFPMDQAHLLRSTACWAACPKVAGRRSTGCWASCTEVTRKLSTGCWAAGCRAQVVRRRSTECWATGPDVAQRRFTGSWATSPAVDRVVTGDWGAITWTIVGETLFSMRNILSQNQKITHPYSGWMTSPGNEAGYLTIQKLTLRTKFQCVSIQGIGNITVLTQNTSCTLNIHEIARKAGHWQTVHT